MTKKQKIKEEYIALFSATPIEERENRFLGIEPYIDDFGWFEGNLNGISENLIDRSGHEIRPKSLQGIEKNNDWIKIESENDLPKEYTNCLCYANGKDWRANLKNDRNSISYCKRLGITHYQLIKKPQPPIY